MSEQDKTCVGEVFIKVSLDDSEALKKLDQLEERIKAISSALADFPNLE